MAIPVASSRQAMSLLAVAAVVVAALAVASCSASRDDAPAPAPAPAPASREIVIQDDPKGEVMVPCSMRRCVEYCVRIGLQPKGFCNMKPDMQVYCCCLVP